MENLPRALQEHHGPLRRAPGTVSWGWRFRYARPGSTRQRRQKVCGLLRYWVVAMMSPPEKVMFAYRNRRTRLSWGNYIDLRHTRAENEAVCVRRWSSFAWSRQHCLKDAKQGQRLQGPARLPPEIHLQRRSPAQVIGTGGSDQSRILTIGQGVSKEGLKRDQAGDHAGWDCGQIGRGLPAYLASAGG